MQNPLKLSQHITHLPPGLLDALENTTHGETEVVLPLWSEFEEKYEILDVLGEGGMGKVYLAKDLNIGRRVAIKFIKHANVNANVLRFFLKEAKITGQLEHPNIIPVYELGVTADDQIYYVMKAVRGTTLEDVLEEIRCGNPSVINNFPLSRLLGIFRRVCDAVFYAHARGVVHLDLKPENILIGRYGEVLVTDWGLATLRKRSEDLQDDESFVNLEDDININLFAGENKILGTPAFMAPEQAMGRTIEVGSRSDIYALGGILYKTLTLRAPHSGKSTTAVIRHKLREKAIDPLVYNEQSLTDSAEMVILRHMPGSTIPPSLAAIAMKALRQRPDQRYQKVSDLINDLEACVTGHIPEAEGKTTMKRRVTFFMRRNSDIIRVVVLTVLIVTLINLIVFYFILHTRQG